MASIYQQIIVKYPFVAQEMEERVGQRGQTSIDILAEIRDEIEVQKDQIAMAPGEAHARRNEYITLLKRIVTEFS